MENQRKKRRSQHQSRLRHRVLHRKRTRHLSDSRSKSSSPEDRTISEDSYDTTVPLDRGRADPTLEEIINNHENYEINPLYGVRYVEPHRPDLIVCKITREHGHIFATSVLVVKVAGCSELSNRSQSAYFEQSVEQNVQQTVASMSCNQDRITGLIVFPDGFKLTQILREQQEYNVKETQLVK